MGGSDHTPNRRGRRGNVDGAPASRRGSEGDNTNSLFAFCRKERAAMRVIMPDATNGETTRELGQRWRALSDEERQVGVLVWSNRLWRLTCEQVFYELVEKQRAERAAAAEAAGRWLLFRPRPTPGEPVPRPAHAGKPPRQRHRRSIVPGPEVRR